MKIKTWQDRKLWHRASTLAELAELTAGWLEGSIRHNPGYPGNGPDPETAGISAVLAKVNRAGFLTDGSQPGSDDSPGYDGATWGQRAAVEGWISPQRARDLVTSAEGAGFLAQDFTVDRQWRRRRQWLGIEVTHRDERIMTGFGSDIKPRDLGTIFPNCSDPAFNEILKSVRVTLVNPTWGASDRLWKFLDEWAEYNGSRR